MGLRVAVVILNWNGKHHLKQFLPNVVQNSHGATLILADNASTDGSVEWVSSNFKQVRVIQNGANLGYAGGYAKALEQVDEEIQVLLNSDVEVAEGWLEPLLNRFEQEKDLGAIQPKILDLSNRTRFEYAGACGGFIDVFGIPFCRGRIFDHLETDLGQYDTRTDVFWATGACLAIRKSAYHQAGGLDAQLFAHMEEIDLCWRMWRSGWRVAVEPASTVWHLGGGTLQKESPFKTYLNFRNGLFVMVRNLNTAGLFWVLPLRLAFDAVAAWHALFTGRPQFFVAVLKAHFHVLLGLPNALGKREGNYEVKPKGIWPKSVILAYFLRKKKKFSDLSW